jgi:hypothetical protein
VPPLALVAVVAISVAGRGSSPASQPAPAAVAIGAPAAGSAAAESGRPALTASPRPDWPAAARHSAAHQASADPIDWAAIYDERADWSVDATAPWSRRLGGLSNFRTDPYER